MKLHHFSYITLLKLQHILLKVAKKIDRSNRGPLSHKTQQTFLSLLRGHNLYFRYQSIVSRVLLRGHNLYHVYWEIAHLKTHAAKTVLVSNTLPLQTVPDPFYVCKERNQTSCKSMV